MEDKMARHVIVWWDRDDPRKSPMYVSFWVFFALMTVSFSLALLYSGIAPEELRSAIPRPLWIMWVAFFSTQLILWVRAQRIIRTRRNSHKSSNHQEGEVPLKKINRFPGWIIVLTPWLVAWLNGLLLVFDRQLLGYEVAFPESAWYVVLGVVTGVFNISDASREKLADDAQKGWGTILDSVLDKVVLPRILAYLDRKLAEKQPADDSGKSG